MGNQGTTTVDFGAYPGHVDAKKTITGQGAILTSNLVEAWICATVAATADHSVDEHIYEDIEFVCTNIVGATGFDIIARSINGKPLYGVYNVAWVWN